MDRIDCKASLGMELRDINRAFDNALYERALRLRKETAKNLLESGDSFWRERELQGDMLQTVLERGPFQNTEEVLKFNLAVTEKVCERVLEGPSSVVEKIGLYAYAVEIGAREFISPDDIGKVYKNLSAAKEKGFFFTPPSVAVRMVLHSMRHAASAENVLDPAAGVGVFLAYHILLDPNVKSVIGIEIDRHTAGLARELLRYVSGNANREINIEIVNENFFDFFERVKGSFEASLIIMNPPYGAVKVLASDLTDASTKAALSKEAAAELERKLKDRTIRYASQLRARLAPYGIGSGTLEFSKLFMAASLQLLSNDGVLVSITPSAWLGDETSSAFRKEILSKKTLCELWIVPEKTKLFKGVNQPTAVSVLSKKGSSTVRVYDAVSRIEQVDDAADIFDMDAVLNVSGDKMKFPQCTERSLLLLDKIRDMGKVKDIPELVNLRGELDLTVHKRFVASNKTRHRLVRGDHIQGSKLGPAGSSDKAGYVHFAPFMQAIERSGKAKYINMDRIAIPQCSYLQKKKRIEAAIVPKGMVIANSCDFLAVIDPEQGPEKLRYYWMAMNSSVIEWQFRIFSYNNHIANKEIDELTCVPYEELSEKERAFLEDLASGADKGRSTPAMDAFIARVFRLTAEEYDAVLESVGKQDRALCMTEFERMGDDL